jgi:hypothetical protein
VGVGEAGDLATLTTRVYPRKIINRESGMLGF